ncbi:hypothetical protein H4Q26_012610 [Puccinia striiformis f. sp. tritici PST-130]|nr:hypothetical protein H4Q26_012610 [Puccinia striiformis f. sp. tritici PST-130]
MTGVFSLVGSWYIAPVIAELAQGLTGQVGHWINYICRRIASNPQKQAEWKLWAGKLGYTGRGVIGGFGIRWNIAYDSRQRAYEGQRVIKQLLENKSDKCGGQSAAKHFFNSYELSSREWEDANSLNQVLKEFLEMTNRLEGDGPLLPMVLYEYFRLLDSLEKKKRAAESTALEQMFYPMIVITNKYLNLAVTCDTLTSLKSQIFGERDELLKLLQPNPTPPEGTQSELNASPNDSDSDGDAFNYYPTNGDTIEVNTELEHYNNGDFPLDKKGCVLGWWKARLSKDEINQMVNNAESYNTKGEVVATQIKPNKNGLESSSYNLQNSGLAAFQAFSASSASQLQHLFPISRLQDCQHW